MKGWLMVWPQAMGRAAGREAAAWAGCGTGRKPPPSAPLPLRIVRALNAISAFPPVTLTTRTNDVEGAVRLLLEAIPNLKTFKIDVDESGEIHVEHTVREVRVIETKGSLKLKK